MISLNDFPTPFDAVLEFENQIAKFTNAPYCVTTDCCTHAIEIVFRLLKIKKTQFPSKTYLSIPMLMHKLNVEYTLTDSEWRGSYKFLETNVWDSAREFKENMYIPGQIQCISFGLTKPLEIGLGGCILTDDYNLYKLASAMRYDGRYIHDFKLWADQKVFNIGYHYYLRPEECVIGLNKLTKKDFTIQEEKFYNYPDCRQIKIID